ncbi:MAG: OmpA family protein [Fibrobacter sp.]|nr:OmpA family protein [Fibrobacter sp.]
MKRVITGLALALAVGAFASHPQTINKYGFVGVNKTQSAQSLGHSKLVFVLLGDATFGNDMFPQYPGLFGENNEPLAPGGYSLMDNSHKATVNDYTGASAYTGFAIGIFNYFDIGVTLPIYYDQFTGETACSAEEVQAGLCDPSALPSTKVGYIGNLRGDIKIRFPLPEDQPMDVAVFGQVAAGTANAEKQGIWIREPEYINKVNRIARPFGTKNTTITGGLAVTADFDKIDAIPLLIHLNGGYRYTTNGDYLSLPFMSAAADIYFTDFLSLFVEYYWDIELDDFSVCTGYDAAGKCNKTRDESLDMKQLTGALVFHLPIGLDIHVGASYYLGNDNFITGTSVLENSERPAGVAVWETRVNPEYAVYGGLTWSGFLLPQDRDGDGVTDDEDDCPDDVGHRLNKGCPLGNPDADEDGVCDAWVAEKGFEDEFADVCEGVDECPNESGEGEDGCPLDDPDMDKDGVCDPWVSQKKMTKKFKDICEGIDECPSQPGSVAFAGCPTKAPDPDNDGMCSPWVTDEGVLGDFADQCKGYDMCPGEAGPKANKGCPWDDPDADGDGLCDAWVTEKKMGYYFEKAAEDDKIKNEWFIDKTCKGIDKCPSEFGPASNEGCPLGNPDTDEDGICDAWVTEKGLLDQYDGICSGIDKCPTEKGEAFAQGCPMDNPDADGDSLCAPWVSEKGMTKDFKDICHGVDKCPAEAGPEWNKGCPAENPDPDGDSLCSPWVTKQKMLDQFKDICTGYDRCEDEAGPSWNKGCPMEDDPDADKDGVCSEWVSNKKLQKEFEGVCTGIDRCPDVPGDDGHGCPKKAVEKLDGVTFKSGKATLESNAKMILKNVAKKLNTDEYKDLNIVIQGHTDNVGKEKTNEKLSKQRAESVMKELAKAGVNKKRIKAIGLGSSCPVDDNSTADGREMNRRIEMHFVTPDNDGTKCESNFVP